MESRSDNGFCRITCWIISALLGLLAAIWLMRSMNWSVITAIIAGLVAFAVLGYVLSRVFCSSSSEYSGSNLSSTAAKGAAAAGAVGAAGAAMAANAADAGRDAVTGAVDAGRDAASGAVDAGRGALGAVGDMGADASAAAKAQYDDAMAKASSCRTVCWVIAGLLGIGVAYWLFRSMGVGGLMSVLAGLVAFAILGFLLSRLFCQSASDYAASLKAGGLATGAAVAGAGAMAARSSAQAETAVDDAESAAARRRAQEAADAEAARAQAREQAAAANARAEAEAAEAEAKRQAEAAEAEAKRQAEAAEAAAEAERQRAQADAEAARRQAAAEADAAKQRAAAEAQAEKDRAEAAARARADADAKAAADAARAKADAAARAKAEAEAAEAKAKADAAARAKAEAEAAAAARKKAAASAAPVAGFAEAPVSGGIAASVGTRPEGISGPRGGKADDLKLISGVGPKMEKMLNGMGYYHFDQIADWGPNEVAWVDENLEGFKGRVTRDEWVPQARILARGGRDYDGDGKLEGANEGTRPAGLSAARGGRADDLKQIKGVGPKLEKLLHRLGFYHFDQVAAWKADEVAWVDANLEGFKGRVSRDNWVEQARVLAAGGETEFSKRVEDGDVY